MIPARGRDDGGAGAVVSSADPGTVVNTMPRLCAHPSRSVTERTSAGCENARGVSSLAALAANYPTALKNEPSAVGTFSWRYHG